LFKKMSFKLPNYVIAAAHIYSQTLIREPHTAFGDNNQCASSGEVPPPSPPTRGGGEGRGSLPE